MLTTALTALLTLTPPPELPLHRFDTQLDHVEYTNDGESVEVIAYDAHGTVIGVTGMFVDSRGDLWLVSDYDDGYADVRIDGEGTAHVTTDLPESAIRRRAEAMAERIAAPGTPPQEGWGLCAAKTVLAGVACTGPQYLWACAPASFIAACECIPLIIPDDWKYEEC